MSIKTEHRNLETRKTRNDFSVQVWNLLLPLSLKVQHKERGTIFLYWLFHLPPPNTCGNSHKGLRDQAKTNRLPPRQVLSQLSDCFKISQNPLRSSGAWRQPHSVTSLPMWAIVTSLSDTSVPPTLVRTPLLMMHLSNPCTEPKGSQPN